MNVYGNIFDIRRFSTHDGDGIRTTVFLKGCPLCCVWCQNPEGVSLERRLLYFETRCIHCGTCLRIDPQHVKLQEGKLRFDPTWKDWKDTIEACPTNALVMDSSFYTVEELMEVLRRDKAFYRYGGGVTLSGGEPLLQSAFCREVLKACRAEGIHAALETSLFAPLDTVGSILPFIDQLFADLKVLDDTLHRKFTGQSNREILRNIEMLLHSPARERITIRTPLIPGMTATVENIEQSAGFLAGLWPDVRYELLNYNPLALSKYALVGRTYCFETNPRRFTGDEMRVFREIARKAGAKRAFIEQATETKESVRMEPRGQVR